jgi:hypothetical protein
VKKVAIHSVPRSGSSWLGEIVNSSPEVCFRFQPLFSYEFKGRLNEFSTAEEIDNFFHDLRGAGSDFVLQREQKQKGNFPVFKKTAPTAIAYKEVRYHYILPNLLSQHPEVCLIALVRNPLSVIYSWLNASKEFRKDLGWEVQKEWKLAPLKNAGKKEEYNGFEKWKEAARLFHRLQSDFPKRVLIVNYRDLLKNTASEVTSIFDFTGISMEKQTLSFLKASLSTSNKNPYAVFRNNPADDKWKGRLPQNIIEEVYAELVGTELEKYLKD